MEKEQRHEQLRQIERARGSRAIAYITGDRENAGTKIGMDVFPFFYQVLSKIGPTPKIDILLYSTGGATMAAWGLANLIKEFCDEFSVLIPFKAHSTATLLALGANEIVMGRLGQLSPVDPTVTSPFNPQLAPNPLQPLPQLLPVSVEDVVAYLELAKQEAGLESEASMVEIFKKLSDNIQPMALGSVYRAKEQIKLLSKRLLCFHMDDEKEDKKIQTIIKALTRELFSHDYLIGRREAKETIKLKVTIPDQSLEAVIWTAFSAYASAIELFVPYNSSVALGTADQQVVTVNGAYIESTDAGFVHRTVREVRRFGRGDVPGMPQVAGIGEQVLNQGWVET